MRLGSNTFVGVVIIINVNLVKTVENTRFTFKNYFHDISFQLVGNPAGISSGQGYSSACKYILSLVRPSPQHKLSTNWPYVVMKLVIQTAHTGTDTH